MNTLRTINLPGEITELLRALSNVGFFERSALIGSWVMPIYQELYQARYILKTLDIDFAVYAAHPPRDLRVDLEKIITGIGFTDYLSNAGVQKFSSGGYEVEFLVQRKGGIESDAVSIREWNVVAQPLPFVNILIDFSEEAKLDDFIIRFPTPEAFFVHKLIVAPRRRSEAKKLKDLDQCSVLVNVLRDDRLLHVVQSLRMGRETKKNLRSSSKAIGFPLQKLGFE